MQNALIYLIETFTRLYLLLLLMRFWLPLLRANFHNPIAQGVLRFTSPAVISVRRFTPAIGQVDTATVLIALLIQISLVMVVRLIAGGVASVQAVLELPGRLIFHALLELASMSVTLFIVAIIIRVILSFFQRYFGPISDMLNEMTEPLMLPIRRIIPPLGVIDLSAYIATVLLLALNMIIADLQMPM
ncbi:MAG: YggT family protein [Woeseiaceae bacterium]|nr:YggT family protein [Woeseiaceae bacterium]